MGLLVLLLGAALNSPFFGVQFGQSHLAIVDNFKPVDLIGEPSWSLESGGDVRTLRYRCLSAQRCSSEPQEAEFHLVGDKLVALSYAFGASPTRDDLIETRLRNNGWAYPIARTEGVGRRSYYYSKGTSTLVHIQDSGQLHLKLYHDPHAPVGRAEALAAGAQLSGPKAPGLIAYSDAHRFITERSFGQAHGRLEALLAMEKIAPLLRRDARFVLALVLATRAKLAIESKGSLPIQTRQVREWIDRAAVLAPQLAGDLAALRERLQR